MKSFKKLTAVLLVAIIMASALAVSSFAQGESYLTFANAGSYYRVSKCQVQARGVIDIPAAYNGLPVSEIGGGAFSSCSQITQVNIPASVTKVSANAFDSCTDLKSVVFSGSECQIDSAAFIHCSGLESVTLPSKLTEIPNEAFSDCTSLKSIDIPSTVTTIGVEAFKMCGKLTQISIPASVTTIRKNAFIACNGVTAFSVASGNPVYSSVNGCIYGPYESRYDSEISNAISDKTLIQYPNGSERTQFTVSAGTLRIGDYAFGENAYLTQINLPAGLERIDNSAFYSCKALSTLEIPSTVTTIGSQAFARCPVLKSMVIPAGVTDFESAFYMSGIERVVISSGVSEISIRAFEQCKSLTSVTIPQSVVKIEAGAFLGCSSLSQLTLHSGIKTIGTNAFGDCTALMLTVDSGSYAQSYAQSNSIPYRISGSTDPSDNQVKAISIVSLPTKTSYNYKQSLDTSGMQVLAVYSDNGTRTITSGFTVSPTVLSKTGTQIITVTYEGCSDSFTVDVSYSFLQMIIMIVFLGFLWY